MDEDWFNGLISCYTDAASLCTSWQQDFIESFADKVAKYGNDAMVSEKQRLQLNKIADIYGYPLLKP